LLAGFGINNDTLVDISRTLLDGRKKNKKNSYPVQLGPCPYWLVDQMSDSTLKETLGKSFLQIM